MKPPPTAFPGSYRAVSGELSSKEAIGLQCRAQGCSAQIKAPCLVRRAVECCNQSQCPAAEGKSPSGSPPSKGSLFTRGYPTGYPTAAPAYNPNMYPTSSPGYAPATLLMKQAWPQTSSSCATEGTFHLPVDTGTENRTYQASSAAFRYTAGTPYKVPPTQSNNAPPPYSPSPNPYQTAMYPIRSAYPQQNLYTQGAYYTQPVYAAQPHVIHHTTVVQPNSIPSAIYPAPVAAPRTNGVAMGMVAGTTMAMSAGTLLTTPQHTAIGAHPVSVPTYRAQGTPTYSYVPPHW
ncbi:protein FAM168A isoform X8 [Gallus gallus]|uniref:protein FAM168A isoform X8 n=1 Tax=Gallus gallus TaxID=9031 RepID=UPI001AE81F79|nr:protein FAM168A isoform X8 [Gallus gallus]XP_040517843.1 protein FAM168A isoform X8 [Gallus gallus]